MGFENHRKRKLFSLTKGPLPIHKFPSGDNLSYTTSEFIPDTALEDKWDPYFGMNWIRSYLGLLLYGDQVIGIINLCSDEINAFGEVKANNLKAFAASVRRAIKQKGATPPEPSAACGADCGSSGFSEQR
jgi:hypothetical protein